MGKGKQRAARRARITKGAKRLTKSNRVTVFELWELREVLNGFPLLYVPPPWSPRNKIPYPRYAFLDALIHAASVGLHTKRKYKERADETD